MLKSFNFLICRFIRENVKLVFPIFFHEKVKSKSDKSLYEYLLNSVKAQLVCEKTLQK